MSPQKQGPVLPVWLSGVQLRTQNPPEEAPGTHNDLACYSQPWGSCGCRVHRTRRGQTKVAVDKLRGWACLPRPS